MIIDSNNLPSDTTLEYGVCIIGAGAAGVTIASELSGKFRDICIIEGGGPDYSRKSQILYRGEITGDRYYPLHLSRLRYYGGSTNHWGGASIPFDEFDFIKRDWIPYSGWPIGLKELESYYKRANDLLKIDNYCYEFDRSKPEYEGKPEYGIFNKILQYSRLDDGKFGSHFWNELKSSESISVLFNCNAIKLLTDESGSTIKSVSLKVLQGKNLTVRAMYFILAMGGIENPRLLLLSTDVYKNGLGNQHDLVGRYFMDHIFYYSGIVKFKNIRIRNQIKPFIHNESGNQRKIGLISPDYEFLSTNRISNCNTYLLSRSKLKLGENYNSDSNLSALIIKDDLLRLRIPIEFKSNIKSLISGTDKVIKIIIYQLIDIFRFEKEIALRTCIEQVPNPGNRVILSEEKDFLGINKVVLKWDMGSEEKRTLEKYHEYLKSRLISSGICDLNFMDENELNANYGPGHHHMGTTKMSEDSKTGVVDKHCRVFGISNLYIAGSSVFPTGGVANPTLTIIALGIRLAEHIKTKFHI